MKSTSHRSFCLLALASSLAACHQRAGSATPDGSEVVPDAGAPDDAAATTDATAPSAAPDSTPALSSDAAADGGPTEVEPLPTPGPSCGDGVVNGAEVCDGTPPPAAQTCLDFGFERGLLGCSALCAPSFDSCGHVGWREVPSHTTNHLYGVWGSGPRDVFAVGQAGSIVHFDGATWSPMTSPTAQTLHGAWGSGPRDVWAVGEGATIVHYDGAAWTATTPVPNVATSVSGQPYTAIWGSDARNVYAVGGATIVHWNGEAWSVDSSSGRQLMSVWGSGPDDVYAAGYGGTLHWDGATWSPLPIATYNNGVVWGTSANDVYLGGFDGMRHWNGSSWKGVRPGYPNWWNAMWGSGPDDVFAVSFPRNADQPADISHWNGSSWTRVFGGPGSGGSFSFAGAWGSGPGDVFVVGSANQILRGGETAWTRTTPGTSSLSAVWADDAGVTIAAGFDSDEDYKTGTVLSGTLSTLTKVAAEPSRQPFLGVWGNRADDVYLVGGSGVSRWDGKSRADLGPDFPFSGTAVWSSGPDDIVALGTRLNNLYAGPAGDGIARWDGTQWTWADVKDIGAPSALTAVWGAARDDVFAVGKGGSILHWNDREWQPMSSGTTADLKAVWGTTATNVYVVGAAGTILRYDGTSWNALASNTTETLVAVGGSGPGDVFATSTTTLLHARGGAWEPLTLPTPVRAMWVTPRRILFATGATVLALDRFTMIPAEPESLCADGWDNDGNGFVDCADPACADAPTCPKR